MVSEVKTITPKIIKKLKMKTEGGGVAGSKVRPWVPPTLAVDATD